MSRLLSISIVLLALLLSGGLQHCACVPFLCRSDADCKAATPERPYCYYTRCQACIEDHQCPTGTGRLCVEGRCSSTGESTTESVAKEPVFDGVPVESHRLDASDADPPEPSENSSPDTPAGEHPSEQSAPVCPKSCVSSEDCRASACASRTSCANGACVVPQSQCPAGNKCQTDADCSQCGLRTVCFNQQCIEPSCPGSCSENLHCQACAGKNKSCLQDPFCTTPPCSSQCGDSTCNPFGCSSDEECKGCGGGATLCDSTSGISGSCTKILCPTSCESDKDCSHCDHGNLCDVNVQMCEGWTRCQTDADCAARPVQPATPFCDSRNGQCLMCRDDADCPSKLQPRCDLSEHRCVACLASSDCQDPKSPFCHPTRRICVKCLSTSDCGLHQICGAAGLCEVKEGHLCDLSGVSAPSRCVSGAGCRVIDKVFGALGMCLKSCPLSAPAPCETGFVCVKTSTSTSTGHCVAGCGASDCSKYPGLACDLVTFSKGAVCAPAMGVAGGPGFGQACAGTGRVCGRGLFCAGGVGQGSGLCSRSCQKSDDCSGSSLKKCAVHVGEFQLCAVSCDGGPACPKGTNCSPVSKACLP